MYGELLSVICEKLFDAEITFEQAESLVDELDARYSNGSYFEGANKEYKAEFKRLKKQYKEVIKRIKKAVKNPTEDGREAFMKDVDEAEKLIEDTKQAINDIPSDVSAIITGYIGISVTDYIKWTIPALVTGGIVGAVVISRKIIEDIIGICKAINKDERTEDALNIYRRRILEKFDKFSRQLKLLRAKYDANLEKTKKTDTAKKTDAKD